MQILTVYDVQEIDGCGNRNHKFYITSKAEADRYVAENKYDAAYEKTIELFDTLDEWQEWNKAELKKRALSKLTAEERASLGYY